MAVSRAAVLQSLVLDESLRQYQTSAINTVQNMASTFTNIAHALQKQKMESTQFEQVLQKQINALIMTINEQASVIEDLKATQDSWSERFGLLSKGDPEKSKYSIAARLSRIEQYLSLAEDEAHVQNYAQLAGYTDSAAQNGYGLQSNGNHATSTAAALMGGNNQTNMSAGTGAQASTSGGLPAQTGTVVAGVAGVGVGGDVRDESLVLPAISRSGAQQLQGSQGALASQALPAGASAGAGAGGMGAMGSGGAVPTAGSGVPGGVSGGTGNALTRNTSGMGVSASAATGTSAGAVGRGAVLSSSEAQAVGAHAHAQAQAQGQMQGQGQGAGSMPGQHLPAGTIVLSEQVGTGMGAGMGVGVGAGGQAAGTTVVMHQHNHHHSHANVALPQPVTGRVLPLPSRMQALEQKLAQIEGYIGTRAGNGYESRLEAILSEKEPDVLARRQTVEKRVEAQETALQEYRGELTRMRAEIDRVQAMLDAVQAKMSLQAETTHASLGQVREDVDAMQTQLDGTVMDLRERMQVAADDMAHKHALTSESISKLQTAVDGKADVRLVLDKVSKHEWMASVRRLQQATDDIAAKSLGKHEYKQHMEQLRDTMVEDQANRERNIARLANELQRVIQDLSGKASKADLVDVANVLATFPHVHRELDHLKMFVDQEIASKHDLQLLQESVVSQKQLRRHTEKLLRAIGDELHKDPVGALGGAVLGGVTAGAQGLPLTCMSVTATPASSGVCDVCSKKTNLYGSPTCMSCLQKLRTRQGLNNSAMQSFLATKGGGFALVAPKKNDKLYVPLHMSGGVPRAKTAVASVVGTIAGAPATTHGEANAGTSDTTPSEGGDTGSVESTAQGSSPVAPAPGAMSARGNKARTTGSLPTMSATGSKNSTRGMNPTAISEEDGPGNTTGPTFAGSNFRQTIGSDGKLYTSMGVKSHTVMIRKDTSKK